MSRKLLLFVASLRLVIIYGSLFGKAKLIPSVCSEVEKLCKGKLLSKIELNKKLYFPEGFRKERLYRTIAKRLDEKFVLKKQQLDIRGYNKFLKDFQYKIDVYQLSAISAGKKRKIKYINLINDYVELEYLYMISNTVKIYGFEEWADVFSPSVELLDSIKIEEIHTHENITVARFSIPEGTSDFLMKYEGKEKQIHYSVPEIIEQDDSIYATFTFNHENLEKDDTEYEFLEGDFRFLDENGEYRVMPQWIRLY